MKIGVVESNGAQNYINWQEMKKRLPYGADSGDDTIYNLDDNYYSNNGGVFETSAYYDNYLKKFNNL